MADNLFNTFLKIQEEKNKGLGKESVSPEIYFPQQNNNADLLIQQYNPSLTGHSYKAWTDAFGNVNLSDLTSGVTERTYQRHGVQTKTDEELANSGKEDFGTDIHQAFGGAIRRQGANYQSALATLGLAAGGLIHGDNNWKPEVGSGLWKLTESAEATSGSANRALQDAKQGRGFLGRTVMDLTSGAVDLAGDQLVNLLAPGAGLALMGVRSFGGSSEEAREQGKTISTQVFKGAKSAAIEIATENLWKIGGVGAGGEGMLQGGLDTAYVNFVEKGGDALLGKLGLAFGTEAVEEMLSDVLNPLADKVIHGIVKGDYDVEDIGSIGDVLYDGLVGGLLGLLGGLSEGVNVNKEIAESGSRGAWAKSERARMAEDADAAQKAKDAKRTLRTLKRAETIAKFKSLAQKQIENDLSKASEMKANEEVAKTPQEAPKATDQQTTPDETKVSVKGRSEELNSNVEDKAKSFNADEINQDVEPLDIEDAKEVLRQKDAEAETLREEFKTAETNRAADIQKELDNHAAWREYFTEKYNLNNDAVNQQKGKTNGTEERESDASRRDDIQPDARLGGQGDKGNVRQVAEGGNVAPGQSGNGTSQSGVKSAERANKLYNSIEKRSTGKSQVIREQAIKRFSNAIDIKALNDAIERGGLDEAASTKLAQDEAVSAMLNNSIENGSGDLVAELVGTGIDEKTATEIAKEVLGEDYKEDVPFEYEDKKPKPEPIKRSTSKTVQMGKLDITKGKDGKTVATVRKQGNTYSEHIDKSTKTVRLTNEKYTRKYGDRTVAKNYKTGSRIIQRGVGDNYYIVNKNGNIEGNVYDDFRKAKARLFGSSNSYSMAEIPLADNTLTRFENGQMVVDTDAAFTNSDILISQTRSMASDSLDVELNTYGGSAVTTDMFSINFSNTDNDGNQRSPEEVFSMTKRLRQIMCGVKNKDGSWKVKPGLDGKNGKHYVFAGQTSSQSKNNIVVMMEENAYNQFRKDMVGGLDPDEQMKFNPAKYLTNRGTFFTPSNADTGVKIKDCIVMADVYHTMHNVTRRFLRTSDLGKDKDALMKMGLDEETAEAKLREYKVGEAFLVTGDIILKSTDGTGFIWSDKGDSFQFRSAGGFKGLLQSFDFVNYLYEVIPYDEDAEYIWTDDQGKTTGGIKYTDKSTGIEILDKWGKWQPINGKKAFLFDSTVKFASEYKSSEDFYKRAGDYDIRSIPKENVYGANPDAGMVEGYDRRGLAQALRSQTAFSQKDLDSIISEHVTDVVAKIMSDTKLQAKLFGVDLDSKTPPISTDLKATLIWYFGEKMLKSKQGQKWVSKKLGQIAEDFRGGRLYFEKGKSQYQWVAPDPFGLIEAMTSLRYQDYERQVVDGKKYKGYSGLKRGQISANNMAEGLSLIARYPSMEENDVQLRNNVRNEYYDELISKYGLSPDITYFALNDELSLNLDNDFDGDATLVAQGALARAIQENRRRAGIDPETGAKKGGLFTEFVHGTAEKNFIQSADVMLGAVRAGLEGEQIGKFDLYIDYLQSMPAKLLRKSANKRGLSVDEFRSMLLMDFAAAYKFNVDYAKTGWYPNEFKCVVDNYMKEIDEIAENNGFFIGQGYRPVPASWQFSSKAKKRDAYEAAAKKQAELKAKGKKNWRLIYNGSNNALTQLLYSGSNTSKSLGLENKASLHPAKTISDYYDFYKETLEKLNGNAPLDLTDLITVDPLAYTNLPPEFIAKLSETYAAIMKSQGDGNRSNAHREKLLGKMFKLFGLDSDQFSSLMGYALSVNTDRANWDTYFNFDPDTEGQDSVGTILSRNARILGNLATIGERMGELRQDMYDAIEHTDKSREKLNALKEERADTVIIKKEFQNFLSELSAQYSSLETLFKRLKFSEESFKQRVASGKQVEALVGEAEELTRFQDKLEIFESKLDAIASEAEEMYNAADEAKQIITDLNHEVRASMKEFKRTLETVNGVLGMINDEYNRWLQRFETEETKREFYGVGLETETGLEYAALDELSDKLDEIAKEALSTTATKNAEKAKEEKRNIKQPPKEEPKSNDNPAPKEEPKQVPKEEPTPPKAEEPKAEEAPKEEKEVVDRRKTYGDSYGNIERAAEAVSNNIGSGAKVAVPDSVESYLGNKFGEARHDIFEFGKEFINAIDAEDGGEALVAFANSLSDKIKKSGALHFMLGDADIGIVAKAAKRVVAMQNAKNKIAFQTAISDFAEVVAKEVETLPKTLGALSKMKNALDKAGPIAKFLAGTNAGNKIASLYFGYQRNISSILMGLDNFDKFGKGPGYTLVKQLEDAVFNTMTISANATMNNMMAKEAFDKSEASKKTVTLEVIKKSEKESHEISMDIAVDMLHTLNTLEQSKINAWHNMSYHFGEDSLRINNEGQYKNVKEALEKAVFGDADAKAYYDYFTENYDMYADSTHDAIAAASGRDVAMFEKGKYYPLWTLGEGKEKLSAKDYNYGIDDAIYTRSRIKIDAGSIRLMNPTERFTMYQSMGDKVLANSQFGANLERLNRSGLGDNLEDIVEKRYGAGHTDIVRQTIKNANDFRAESDEASSVLRSLRLNIQTGALFGNFGSMLKQFPSVFNAVGVVDYDDILYGIGALMSKEQRAKASELGAIKGRYLGAYDPDVHDAFEDETSFQKFYKKLTENAPWLKVFSDGFKRIDSNAIKTVYLACRHNIAKSGIPESDADFDNKVLELFKPAFLRTQPQYNKLLRPYVQASDKEIIRMFGMFKTQPLQNFNTMIRAVGEYNSAKEKYGVNSDEFRSVSKQLRGVISGQATASLMFGMLGVLAKLLYHRRKDLTDDEGNLDGGKVMARALMNAAEATSGMVVFGDAAAQFVIDVLSGGKTNEFYGLNAGAISSVMDAVDAITSFAENPSTYGAKKAAGYIAQLMGIPLNNAYAILNSAVMYTKDFAGTNEKNYDDMLKFLDKQIKTAKQEEEKAAKAAPKEEIKQNSVSQYLKKPYQALIDSGIPEQETNDLLSDIDTDNNSSIKQQELIDYYKAHPEQEALIEAIWNAYGWKKTWASAKGK